MYRLGQLCLLLCGMASMAWPSHVPAVERPNILIIMSDDMGYSDLGCYGGEINTPNLDALARGGLRFTQFYNTARCCPTRASLLTGLYPHQAGMGHMTEDRGPEFPGYRGEISRFCPTIAEVLGPAGYRTYMVGKWHVARQIAPNSPRDNWPLQRGFDRFYGMVSGGGSYFDPFTLTRGNQPTSPYDDPEYKSTTYYFTDAISDQAVQFLKDHATNSRDQPFFMYVAYTAAHWPMHALPEDIARYRGSYSAGYEAIRRARLAKAKELGIVSPEEGLSPPDESWEAVPDEEFEASFMEVYAAMVDRMDQGIGRIVEELRRQGRLDNTLVLYLQDNGGCAETMGRVKREGRIDGPRAEAPTLPPIPATALPNGLVPPQTRDGYPVRQGPHVEPGPADTYVAYGRGWANVSNTPFREYKHWVHEGGISTPLIAHWPASIKTAGELRTQPGHVIDLMATCLDLTGIPFPQEWNGQPSTRPEGISLLPAFRNEPLTREALYWEHEGNRAIRVGDWKLVAKEPAGPWELYDLSADRVESQDLAAKQPELVAKLQKQWEAWAERCHVLPWIWETPYQPSTGNTR